MREAELSGPISAWLAKRGYAVYAEVPWRGRVIDLVGVRGAVTVAVELKGCMRWQVMEQAVNNQQYATLSFAAVGGVPHRTRLERLADLGIGVLVVTAHGARMVQKPNPRRFPAMADRKTLERFGAFLRRLPRGGVGGHPCERGHGPAKRCYRALRAYLEEHPEASWRELYAMVPSHYVSARNMRLAMQMQARLADEEPFLGVPRR